MKNGFVIASIAAGSLLLGSFWHQQGGRVQAQAQKPANDFAAVPGEIGGQDIFGPYDVVKTWPKDLSTLPGNEKWTWGAVQGIYAETPNRVFMLMRGEHERAIELLRDCLANNDGRVDWANKLGNILHSRNRFAEARETAARVHRVRAVDERRSVLDRLAALRLQLGRGRFVGGRRCRERGGIPAAGIGGVHGGDPGFRRTHRRRLRRPNPTPGLPSRPRLRRR